MKDKSLPFLALLGATALLLDGSALAKNAEAGHLFPLRFDFPNGDLQHWQALTPNGEGGVQPNTAKFRHYSVASLEPLLQYSLTGMVTPRWLPSGVMVVDGPERAGYQARDNDHPSSILRSPEFTVDPHQGDTSAGAGMCTAISFRFQFIGGNSASSSVPTNVSDLPYPDSVPSRSPQDYKGVALRRVKDNAYLLWGTKPSTSNTPQIVEWDANTLAAATANDPEGTLYTLDILDTGHGGWGWMLTDFVEIMSSTSPTIKLAPQPGPSSYPLRFDFLNSDTQGWRALDSRGNATTEELRFKAIEQNKDLYSQPGSGMPAVTVYTGNWNHDTVHPASILRSPAFTVDPASTATSPGAGMATVSSLSLIITGGSGKTSGAPSKVDDLPYPDAVDNSEPNAYMGVALRRDSDDTYLLWNRKQVAGNNYETVKWDAATLAAATAGDAPGTLYTIDVVDAYLGGWGAFGVVNVDMVSSTEPQFTTVSVETVDAEGSIFGPDNELAVRFTRDGDLSQPLRIGFVVGGAHEFLDFDAFPGNVEYLGANASGDVYEITIAANEDHADLPFELIDPGEYGPDLFVTVTGQAGAGYRLGKAHASSLVIRDFPANPAFGFALDSPAVGREYYQIPNPFQSSVTGSLFFYAEASKVDSWLALGLTQQPYPSTLFGAAGLGRVEEDNGFALFDFFNHPGASEDVARLAPFPEFPMEEGKHYTIIGELQKNAYGSGTLKAWIWDGTNGSLDYDMPAVVSSYDIGFRDLTDTLYLRAAGAGNTVLRNLLVTSVEGSDPQDRKAGFESLVPARPFLYLSMAKDSASSSPADNELIFRLARSGPARGDLTVDLNFDGSAQAGDFLGGLPATAVIADGQSYHDVVLKVAPTVSGEKTIYMALQNGETYLAGSTEVALGTITGGVADPYQDWASQWLLAGADAEPGADPDKDGIPNSLEFYLGTDPTSASNGSLPVLRLVEGAHRYEFQRAAAARGYARARLMSSTDLAGWQLFRTIGDDSGSSDSGVIVTPGTEFDTIRVDVPESGPRLFLRLLVELGQ